MTLVVIEQGRDAIAPLKVALIYDATPSVSVDVYPSLLSFYHRADGMSPTNLGDNVLP
jgi:hypothetical protein